jgi:hypothetical protein
MHDPHPSTADPSEHASKKGRRRPGQSLLCGWCGGQITVRATGRTPKWCSNTCRHRAWEASRAAASGAVAVRVVDRTVEVERAVTVVEQVEVPVTTKGAGWIVALHELARQLNTGRVYDRDLPVMADALNEVLDAYARRPAVVALRRTGRDR